MSHVSEGGGSIVTHHLTAAKICTTMDASREDMFASGVFLLWLTTPLASPVYRSAVPDAARPCSSRDVEGQLSTALRCSAVLQTTPQSAPGQGHTLRNLTHKEDL